ncbi:MAG: hypothetical protein J5779_03080 [Clostridia bacterium]|nr:hypothetical protein [Clostridia bacterium]
MEYKKPEDLPYDFSEEMTDLWAIFTECPLERGSLEVYSAFAQARVQAFNNYKLKTEGMEF